MEMSGIISKDWFKINGISCEGVGLYCDTPPVPPMPKQRVSYYQNGGDTDGYSPDDSFENITYTLRCFTFLNDSFDKTDIYAFIVGARTLEISRCDGYYFKVRAVEMGQPTVKEDGARIMYSIKFTLAPFKYFVDNQEIEINGDTIRNPGNRYARPIYHIEGSNSIVLTVNGEIFKVTGAPETEYYIDAEKMIAYTPDGKNILPKTSGLIPFLQPGVNTIKSSAGKLKVQVNGRCY